MTHLRYVIYGLSFCLWVGSALAADPEPPANRRITIKGHSHELTLITKGDLRAQHRKIAKSGLAAYFEHTEVVAEKDRDTYAWILDRCRVRPAGFVMVGNSLKSDIQPVRLPQDTSLPPKYPTATPTMGPSTT